MEILWHFLVGAICGAHVLHARMGFVLVICVVFMIMTTAEEEETTCREHTFVFALPSSSSCLIFGVCCISDIEVLDYLQLEFVVWIWFCVRFAEFIPLLVIFLIYKAPQRNQK